MLDNGSICRVTIDGVDFRILEPTPFSPCWYSHKHNGPGVRYEIGLCIQTGWIVWVNGPFPCGEWPDLRIARESLIFALDDEEMYCADGGYSDGAQYAETPTGLNNYDQWMKSVARSRHETVNSRFKRFAILSNCFRHDRHLHGSVFMAIANITQLGITTDEPLFHVDYYDRDMEY